MIPENLKYTEDHEWILLEGDVATIGITDHAQAELGDITFVEVPDIDRDVEAGDEFAVIESVKAAADVFAPVAGTVSAINEGLEEAPEKVNESPYTDGWICKISGVKAEDVAELMDASAYEAFIKA